MGDPHQRMLVVLGEVAGCAGVGGVVGCVWASEAEGHDVVKVGVVVCEFCAAPVAEVVGAFAESPPLWDCGGFTGTTTRNDVTLSFWVCFVPCTGFGANMFCVCLVPCTVSNANMFWV